jgi:hypothetical protein
MNCCFQFSDRLLRVLVGPIDESDKQRDVLSEIANKWTNRSAEGFSRDDVANILQRQGGLVGDELENLDDVITTFANFVADTLHAQNAHFSSLAIAIRDHTTGSSLSVGGSSRDASIDPSDASGQSGESSGPNPANDSVETMGPANNVEYRVDWYEY